MNILLVYPNVMGVLRVHLGVAYISSYLKSRGHTVRLLDTTFGITKQDVVRSVKGIDLIGVSVMTLQLPQALWMSRVLKEATSAPVLWGGNHPTVRPLECINYDFVDMVCLGEGEEAVAEVAERLEEGGDVTGIENIWVKKEGLVSRSPLRRPVEDLDRLPWPDREAFDRRHIRAHTGSIVSGSRECPYGCGYCINDHLKTLYRGKGKFSRHRSVDNLIEELSMMREKFGVGYFEFADETFTLRRKWVLEFCEKYGQRFRLPFIFQTRCDNVDHEILKAIRDAGCDTVSFGVESGNETYRRDVLGRKMTDSVITKAFAMAKELGFRVCSFNMVGMPGETEEMVIDTIKINKRLKPHIHNVCIFYPFPGTRLGDLCEEKGWIAREKTSLESYYYDSVLRMPQLDRFTILSYQKFFSLYLKVPTALIPRLARALRLLLIGMYFIQDKTRSRILKEVLNNLYWLSSAMADARLFRKLISRAPYRLFRALKKGAIGGEDIGDHTCP